MQKRWLIKQTPGSETIQTIQETLKVSTLMATLLAQRGLTSRAQIGSFFSSDITQLHDPLLMMNMEEAIETLNRTIAKQQHVFLFGDYDVDGTTAVAVMYEVLQEFTTVSYYIPDRYEEGYGLSYQGIDAALARGAALMIALDCGIKDVEKIAYAREKGLTVIVCDHHTPGAEIPDAIVLDPKQAQCSYPYKELCGCGVGFKLLQGWFERYQTDLSPLFRQLDLVAIAIGADIVPVTGENRVLCSLGLKYLNASPRKGIETLVTIAKRDFPLNLSTVVFTIAPRINAAGRLNSGQRAVELLLASDDHTATAIAAEIDTYNLERRLLDAQITYEALEIIAADHSFAERKSTVVFHPEWHKGVVGIVASRLIEKHYRPTIVLTESKGLATGSARSVAGFNVYEAIESCAHLLEQFGGHHHAAGLTLAVDQVDSFREAFDAYVQNNLTRSEEVEEVVIDAEITLDALFLAGESVVQIPRLLEMIDKMEPFGPGNEKPLFCVRNVYAVNQRVLKEAHLKLDMTDPVTGITLPAIGFNMADKLDTVAPGVPFDAVFTLERNSWNGRTTLQLQLRDVRETV